MGPQSSTGATLMCPFGLAPSTLVAQPARTVMATTPAANVGDVAPALNIPPFGACTSMANPVVAAATAAALGVLTPQPCVPVPAGTWLPGDPKVLVNGMPAVDLSCKLMCAWGGVIQLLNPAQTKVLHG